MYEKLYISLILCNLSSTQSINSKSSYAQFLRNIRYNF